MGHLLRAVDSLSGGLLAVLLVEQGGELGHQVALRTLGAAGELVGDLDGLGEVDGHAGLGHGNAEALHAHAEEVAVLGDVDGVDARAEDLDAGVGERLGRGESLAAIQAGMKQVAEGVWNCAIVVELARAQGIEMPICETVKAVLEARMAARDAVAMLMGRDTKHEAYGA